MAVDSKKLASDLDKIRTKITAGKHALSDLDRQPIAPSDVADRVEQVVQHLAGRFDSAWLGAALAYPQFEAGARDDILAEACTGGPSPGVLLAWLFPSALQERLIDLTTEHAVGVIPLAQRPDEKQRLEQDLYALEVEEERIVCACEEAGVEALRRSDIDPSVVLTAHLET